MHNLASKVCKNHPSSNIIDNLEEWVTTKRKDKVNYLEMIINICFTSLVEPKNVKEILEDDCRVNAMKEELGQFVKSNVWTLIPCPESANVIGTKWIFKNKSDEMALLLEIKHDWRLKGTLK